VIAATFHFPAAELWEMDAEDLQLWVDQVAWLNTR
jgi:hypothetical protein